MTGRRAAAALLALTGLAGACGQEVAPLPGATGRAETPPSSHPERPWRFTDLLDCPERSQSVWTTDPAEPPPGVTVADILRRESTDRVTAVVLDRHGGDVLVGLQEEGRTLSIVHLDRWGRGNDSWFVEGGADCGR